MAKLHLHLLFLWIPLLASQFSSSYPPCALSCLYTDTSGSCGQLDIICYCGSLPYLQTLASCMKSTCSAQDYRNGTSQLTDTCSSNGVSINFSTIVASSTSISTSTTVNTTFASTSSSSVLPSGTSHATAIATFTSGSLLTGTCTTPQFTSSFAAGTVTVFPEIGCHNANLGCCPSNTTLTSCPADYTTTNQACCPSSYSIYSTKLGGETPCYSNLVVPLSTPGANENTSISDSAPTPTILIVDIIFTQKYTLQPLTPRSNGRTTQLRIGIGVGVGVGVVVILVIGFFLWRLRLWKERHKGQHSGTQHQAPANNENLELDAVGTKQHPAQPELDGKARSELPAEPEPARPTELPVQ